MNPKDNPINRYYKQIPDLRFAVLTEAEERDLFLRARSGEEEARQFLIENHLLFAATEARRRARGKLPEEDVVSAGNAALMQCIDRFDPNKGARFTTFLRFYIRAEVSKLWQERDPVDYKKNYPKGDDTSPAFNRPLEDTFEEPHYAADEFKTIVLGVLESACKELTEAEQKLLKRVYEDGVSFAEIGREEGGISREAIRTRHERLLKKLRVIFKGAKELK